MAEDHVNEAAKKRLEEAKKAREQQAHERAARAGGKPTPTQEELDQISLGARPKLEEDGGPPDESGQAMDPEKIRERGRADLAKHQAEAGPPTPSQEELNKIALGKGHEIETRHMEAGGASKPQSYQTRQAQARPNPTPTSTKSE